jgi:heterodisulfide reductase subunit D
VLRALGHDVCYLGEDEPCCGSTAARLGMEDDFRDLAGDVAAAVATTGAELVVTACPGCSSAFREYYPRRGIDLGARVLHVTEVLDQALAEGRLEVKHRLPGRWTYYDPCHLGRVDGVFEPPRRVLQACVEGYVPLPREREESMCCGAGGGYRTAFPSRAASVGGRVVEMAEDVGAQLVTACPWCETNIGEAAAAARRPGGAVGPGDEVLDVVQVVERAMGLGEGAAPAAPRPRRAPGRLV